MAVTVDGCSWYVAFAQEGLRHRRHHQSYDGVLRFDILQAAWCHGRQIFFFFLERSISSILWGSPGSYGATSISIKSSEICHTCVTCTIMHIVMPSPARLSRLATESSRTRLHSLSRCLASVHRGANFG